MVVGAKRSLSSSGTDQIFFSVQLHELNKDPVQQQELIDKMFTELGL